MSEDNIENKETETTEKIEKTIEEQLNEQKDKYLRIIAEYENRMKRNKQDAINSINLAIENIVIDLTPLLQDLEKAIEIIDKEHKIGLELIKKNMQNILKRYGIESIEPTIGEDFDHNMHQAVSSQKKEGIEEGKIVAILKNGFKMKQKVIIPATIIVSE